MLWRHPNGGTSHKLGVQLKDHFPTVTVIPSGQMPQPSGTIQSDTLVVPILGRPRARVPNCGRCHIVHRFHAAPRELRFVSISFYQVPCHVCGRTALAPPCHVPCTMYTYCKKKTVANDFVSSSRQNKATLSRLERVHGTLECPKHRALSKTYLYHSTVIAKEYVSWCAATTVHAVFCPSRGGYVTWVPSYYHTTIL